MQRKNHSTISPPKIVPGLVTNDTCADSNYSIDSPPFGSDEVAG